MQNNDNQTNQKDPHNRGQNGFEYISPGLCSIWLPCTLKFEPISSRMADRYKPTPDQKTSLYIFYISPSEIFWDLEKGFLVRVALRLSAER